MKIKQLLESVIPKISKQQAIDRKLFGPVYHGTTEDARSRIDQEGFKTDNRRNGFNFHNEPQDNPKPIHFLGNGVYFTTVKAIAKAFNNGSTKGLKEYYLDVPNLGTINFGSLNTMSRWWRSNGYDYNPSKGGVSEWVRATDSLTKTLASKYDAVWFKGKSMYRLLDGDQVCVYNPAGKIYQIDTTASSGWDIGSVVTHNQEITYTPAFMKEHGLWVDQETTPHDTSHRGWTFVKRDMHGHPYPLKSIPPPGLKGVIVDKRPLPRDYFDKLGINPRFHNQAQNWITVKWKTGGTLHNYIESELTPVNPIKESIGYQENEDFWIKADGNLHYIKQGSHSIIASKYYPNSFYATANALADGWIRVACWGGIFTVEFTKPSVLAKKRLLHYIRNTSTVFEKYELETGMGDTRELEVSYDLKEFMTKLRRRLNQ